MLKIGFSETPVEERWLLHGCLTKSWAQELRKSWDENHQRGLKRACIVDLNEITCIDKSGERVLRGLIREGAQCLASGIYFKHILKRFTVRANMRLLDRLTASFPAVVLSALALLIPISQYSDYARAVTFFGVWLLGRTNPSKSSNASHLAVQAHQRPNHPK